METQIAAALRGLSREKLVQIAARLAANLERIADERVDSAVEAADAALRNSGCTFIEDLAPSLILEREEAAADAFYGWDETTGWRDQCADMYGVSRGGAL